MKAVIVFMKDKNKKSGIPVDAESESTVSDNNKKAKKKPTARDIVMYVLLGFFVTVFIVCAVIIVDYIADVVREKKLHSEDFGVIGSILDDTGKSPIPVWTRPGQNESEPSSSDVTSSVQPTDDATTSGVPSDEPTSSSVPVDSDEPSGTTSESDVTTSTPSDDTTVTESDTVTDEVTTTTPIPDDEIYSDKFLEIRNELVALNSQYPDIIGYISIPILGIKYPLLNRPQDTSNMYYLTHNEKGQEMKSGAIYTDYRCSRYLLNNKNLVIYGHNMRSGSMFGTLSKIVTNENAFKQAEIIIATFDGIYTYKVFSAYRTNSYDSYCSMYFADDNAFNSFLQGIIQKSVYTSDIKDIGESDKIITLSTCTNITETGRYAVHAVLVKIEK